MAPLTLLVGENSAGKSSFLALIRFAYDLFSYGSQPSFNKAPFFLGAFEQIAHFRGGSAGKEGSFSFSISRRTAGAPTFLVRRSQEALPEEEVTLSLVFHNRYSQPAIAELNFSFGKYRADMIFDKMPRLSVRTPNLSRDMSLRDYLPEERDLAASQSVTYIANIIDDILFQLRSRRTNEPLTELQEQDAGKIASYFGGFLRALRREVYASAPVRTKPDRAYTPLDVAPSPEGDHVPYLLAKLKRHQPQQWNALKRRLDAFGEAAGLFQSLTVKDLGRSESDPFQIRVKLGGPQRNIIDVGYGVSQVLPVVTEILRRDDPTIFLLQQPEVHLHPQAQSALGTFLTEQVKQSRHSVIIETHSDFILDRVRMAVRDGLIAPSDISLLYFQRGKLESRIAQLQIDERGNIIKAPPGYRRFFIDEARRSLR